MMFLGRTVVTFALAFTAVVLAGWYVQRNRKIRREMKNKNDGQHGFDDRQTKNNLSVIQKGNLFVLCLIIYFILLGYFLRMLPTGYTSHLILFLIIVFILHTLMSRYYVINIIWFHGIIYINAEIVAKLFPILRILKIFQLGASGETTT